MSVVVTHNSGFFSCCSIKLKRIVEYINETMKEPVHVDSSHQFAWYKGEVPGDITYDYFTHYSSMDKVTIDPTSMIDYENERADQFCWYSTTDYTGLMPLVEKYFTPSTAIKKVEADIEKKYAIDPTNTCVLFYRGNDKVTETNLCGYNEYIDYANRIIADYPGIRLLIQSDETEFIECMMTEFPDRAMYFEDEARHIPKCESTVDKVMRDKNPLFSKYYLAITLIMSKCKYVVCGSGNCSLWIMLYRWNRLGVLGVYQNLNGVWRDLENKEDDVDDMEEKNARNGRNLRASKMIVKKRIRNMFSSVGL